MQEGENWEGSLALPLASVHVAALLLCIPGSWEFPSPRCP